MTALPILKETKEPHVVVCSSDFFVRHSNFWSQATCPKSTAGLAFRFDSILLHMVERMKNEFKAPLTTDDFVLLWNAVNS